jgi:hypothetical protein
VAKVVMYLAMGLASVNPIFGKDLRFARKLGFRINSGVKLGLDREVERYAACTGLDGGLDRQKLLAPHPSQFVINPKTDPELRLHSEKEP